MSVDKTLNVSFTKEKFEAADKEAKTKGYKDMC